MRHLAVKPVAETFAPSHGTAPMTGTDGPVAAIQRSIIERMAEGGAFDIAVARAPESGFDRGMQLLSRCAGPIALGAGYLVAAQLMLG